MEHRKTISLLSVMILFVLMSSWAAAATLHGTVYDLDLNEVSGVVIEVDSQPAQRFVSKDGLYSFELNPGEYTLIVRYPGELSEDQMTKETVLIEDEGEFLFDIFLIPDLNMEDEPGLADQDIVDVESDIVTESALERGITIAIVAVGIILILLVIYHFVRKRKSEVEQDEMKNVDKLEDEARKELRGSADKTRESSKQQHHDPDHKKVIDILKKEGGRSTQKEIRKHFPLSEAKVSLLISELESKGVLKKVKKGRGNIIILKK